MRRVVIEPMSRVEGRVEVAVRLDEAGRVAGASIAVPELRGFELLAVGRPVRELPALMSRICGICPLAHSVAAAKAGDVLLGAPPPPAARRIRELLLLAQVLQSHALSFFLLSGPDLLPADGPGPRPRDFLALGRAAPAVLADGLLLRRFGQELIERVAGRSVHPGYVVPGGIAAPLAPAVAEELRARLPSALAAAERTVDWWAATLPRRADLARLCGPIDTAFLALVGPGGRLAFEDGKLRLVGSSGAVLEDGIEPAAGLERIAEEPASPGRWKRARWRSLGSGGEGAYRVGPLARLNVAGTCGTPLADQALAAFRAGSAGPVLASIRAHSARLVEVLYALERMRELLEDPAISAQEVRAPAGALVREAVGACEAPRGTLFHHYRIDGDGLVAWADLVIATGQNALALERAVRLAAEEALGSAHAAPGIGAATTEVREAVGAAVRAFDPCFSCSTHALDDGGLAVRVVGPDGSELGGAPS